METVYLLDQIQKGKDISEQDQNNLIEQKLIRIEDKHIYLDDHDRFPETDRGTETDLSAHGQKETDTKTGLSASGLKETDTETDTETSTEKDKQNFQVRLTGTETAIISILRELPYITIIQLAEKMDMSTSGVRYVLRRLRDKGLIGRSGSQKSGKWIVETVPNEQV